MTLLKLLCQMIEIYKINGKMQKKNVLVIFWPLTFKEFWLKMSNATYGCLGFTKRVAIYVVKYTLIVRETNAINFDPVLSE